MNKLFFGLLLTAILTVISAKNVLILSPLASPSHSLWHRILSTELAKRGHNVTIVTPDHSPSFPNHTVIQFEGIYEVFQGTNIVLEETGSESSFSTLLYDWLDFGCPYYLKTNGLKQIQSYPPNFFDVIILDLTINIECFFPLLQKLGTTPLIGTSPFGISPWFSWYTGDWQYPSIDAHIGTTYTDRMNFFERFHNFLLIIYSQVLRTRVEWNTIETLKEFYSKEELTIDFSRNFSLFLVNVDPNLAFPRPLPSNVIPIGGLHVKLQRNIPENLQKWLDEASEGVILFSLGTNLKSSKLSPEKINHLVHAFKEMAPVKVLMKWESDELPNRPENVLTRKWLPQYDVLNHPNVKVLFSHGGTLSLQEAMFAGKPVLGMPFFLDQNFNMNRAAKKGIALISSYSGLTVDGVKADLNQLLHNQTFKENMENLARRVNDQPETPLDRGIFWIEYILRHGHSEELQLASLNQPFWQNYCLDIFFTILILLYIVFKLVEIIFEKLVKACKFGRTSKKLKQN